MKIVLNLFETIFHGKKQLKKLIMFLKEKYERFGK